MSTNEDDTIQGRIKYLRKNILKLTQSEFGDRIGFKQNSIALIESKRNSLTDRTIVSICREFGVNEQWLRLGIGDIFVESPQDEIDLLVKRYNLSEVVRNILVGYIALDNESKKVMDGFIDGVIKGVSSKNEDIERKKDNDYICLNGLTEEQKSYVRKYVNDMAISNK